ncbi:HAD-IA family hydrolase [Aneurinibacillus aneurinilyticus]|jgi:HAD superfamily hydrolase (TIGR01549 family)|uniref:HAD-IA family hydrolase n=2 Tax=Aneurinibacillus aneurinilyticus TaxID=1391 RepID=A0A848CXC6_ANEAE|nr:HAD-IA family hydrolase [Aneurinibacillus aneurinilyticus]ERI10984.1 HAD hydrolase, family IA, variant 1 [Aneurinibacillus aneurinilyticus ATCC 12856]MCI1695617.1 HAD-IA family hydrolase [Aneurinibacillus aneurinilyticus]MED0673088.1 HAD-IA family hydrolase [Aneurinibacillus aneurinilyticus]MED0705978.1 HAD-IA family hydrolase [Aneurinibacillus aneurinilyticus]MED0721343.1 HAD-IA family hydrolase [Aneurinibacillus aneurinilyticus]
MTEAVKPFNKTIQLAVFFDMDGTLLQTENVALPAVKDAFEHLKREGIYKGKTPTREQVLNVFGMTIEQIWNTLMPDASQVVREKANTLMLDYEIERLKNGEGKLYDGVFDVLTRLKENGIPVFVVSNGEKAYIEAVVKYTGLSMLFTDLYSAGRFQTKTKNDLVTKLLNDYRIEHAIMVGDRHSDVEAGKVNGLYTIACDFGFAKEGELDGADTCVTAFTDIVHIINSYIENLK